MYFEKAQRSLPISGERPTKRSVRLAGGSRSCESSASGGSSPSAHAPIDMGRLSGPFLQRGAAASSRPRAERPLPSAGGWKWKAARTPIPSGGDASSSVSTGSRATRTAWPCATWWMPCRLLWLRPRKEAAAFSSSLRRDRSSMLCTRWPYTCVTRSNTIARRVTRTKEETVWMATMCASYTTSIHSSAGSSSSSMLITYSSGRTKTQ
mmetsp:Transcript_17263/g.50081  ORF Transcript_17263/g.50081 Transcript_17263/m.50081 type:complete len:208 (+) Transcript_17263:4238-4861(+)